MSTRKIVIVKLHFKEKQQLQDTKLSKVTVSFSLPGSSKGKKSLCYKMLTLFTYKLSLHFSFTDFYPQGSRIFN